MKRVRLISCRALSVFILACGSVFAQSGNADNPATGQQIFTLTEITKSGKHIDIDRSKTQSPIVGINNRIEVRIDTEAVNARAREYVAGDHDLPIQQLDAMTELLNSEAEYLDAIGQCTLDRDACLQQLSQFSERTLTILDFLEVTPLGTEKADAIFEAELDHQDPVRTYRELLELAADQFRLVTAQIDEDMTEVRFGLRAWMIDSKGAQRKVHLDGFDEFDNGEFYEVPAIIFPSAEELRQETAKLEVALNNIREKGVAGALAVTENITLAMDSLDETADCLAAVLLSTELRQSLAANFPEGEPIGDTVRLIIRESQGLVDDVRSLVETANQIESAGDPLYVIAGFQEKLGHLLSSLPERFNSLSSSIARLPALVSTADAEAGAMGVLGDLQTQVQPCLTGLDRARGSVDALLTMVNALSPKQRRDMIQAGKFFSDKVNRLALDDIPESTTLDLRFTGMRENGNELYFLAALELPPRESDGQPRERQVDHERVLMYQTGLTVGWATGALLVNPVSGDDPEGDNTFYWAPSNSFLLRIWKRNHFWNQMIVPSLGINVSHPDLLRNGSPEIGLGAVATFGHDIVQFGWGYTVLSDIEAGYWFFGFQLPWDVVFGGGVEGTGN